MVSEISVFTPNKHRKTRTGTLHIQPVPSSIFLIAMKPTKIPPAPSACKARQTTPVQRTTATVLMPTGQGISSLIIFASAKFVWKSR